MAAYAPNQNTVGLGYQALKTIIDFGRAKYGAFEEELKARVDDNNWFAKRDQRWARRSSFSGMPTRMALSPITGKDLATTAFVGIIAAAALISTVGFLPVAGLALGAYLAQSIMRRTFKVAANHMTKPSQALQRRDQAASFTAQPPKSEVIDHGPVLKKQLGPRVSTKPGQLIDLPPGDVKVISPSKALTSAQRLALPAPTVVTKALPAPPLATKKRRSRQKIVSAGYNINTSNPGNANPQNFKVNEGQKIGLGTGYNIDTSNAGYANPNVFAAPKAKAPPRAKPGMRSFDAGI